jgi:hypothetical protein
MSRVRTLGAPVKPPTATRGATATRVPALVLVRDATPCAGPRREPTRRAAIERINARIHKAGVDANWTLEAGRPGGSAFDADTASARGAYRSLVAALREAERRASGSDGDGWTCRMRGFVEGLGPTARAWLVADAAGSGPDDWSPLRRLIRHWHHIGVPWRRERDGVWGRPTYGDLALIAIASLSARDLALREGEGFDALFERTTGRVKTECRRLRAWERHELLTGGKR